MQHAISVIIGDALIEPGDTLKINKIDVFTIAGWHEDDVVRYDAVSAYDAKDTSTDWVKVTRLRDNRGFRLNKKYLIPYNLPENKEAIVKVKKKENTIHLRG